MLKLVLEGGPEGAGPILWRGMTNLSIFISFYLFLFIRLIYDVYLMLILCQHIFKKLAFF